MNQNAFFYLQTFLLIDCVTNSPNFLYLQVKIYSLLTSIFDFLNKLRFLTCKLDIS